VTTDPFLAERVARLRAARAVWAPAAADPPRLADDAWSGLAADLYRERERELRAAVLAAGAALDESLALAWWDGRG